MRSPDANTASAAAVGPGKVRSNTAGEAGKDWDVQAMVNDGIISISSCDDNKACTAGGFGFMVMEEHGRVSGGAAAEAVSNSPYYCNNLDVLAPQGMGGW